MNPLVTDPSEHRYTEAEVAQVRTRAFWGGIVVGAAFCLGVLAMLAT